MDWKSDDPLCTLGNLYGLIYFFMAKEVIDSFGDDGEQVVRRALRKYGLFRGNLLRKQHEKKGLPINVKSLFENYDLPQDKRTKRERFIFDETEKDSKYYTCQFADIWKELEGIGDYTNIGKIYCEAFHSAMYEGYDPRIKVDLPSLITKGDSFCKFEVKMDEKDSNKNNVDKV